jgi:hypothetical protein
VALLHHPSDEQNKSEDGHVGTWFPGHPRGFETNPGFPDDIEAVALDQRPEASRMVRCSSARRTIRTGTEPAGDCIEGLLSFYRGRRPGQ